jgi:hypothetical protein
MTLPLWLRNQIVRLQKARTRRRAVQVQREWVVCVCGQPYERDVRPHPETRCIACDSTEMQNWANHGQLIRRIGL